MVVMSDDAEYESAIRAAIAREREARKGRKIDRENRHRALAEFARRKGARTTPPPGAVKRVLKARKRGGR
jgi:hypothetical protein